MPGDDDDRTVDPEGDEPARSGYRIGVGAVVALRTDRYQLGDELGRGGIGKVTSARDRTLQRPVAIKELHEHTEQGRRRFVREGLITARLQHPAIVPVLDAGAWETGDPYLVMKHVEGKTLAEVLATAPSLDARLALLPNLLVIADALAYAHAHGVVHRDVKPGNIMLGAHGETVLLDWGASYDVDEDRDTLVVPAGTPRYMAPEHARGDRPEPAFDVYSLGVTLAAVLDDNAGAVPASIPVDLVAIVEKATAERAQRYAHAGQLADDLRRFIAGQLVSARRYTRGALAWRWIRRHRIVVLALGAIAVISAIAVHSVVRERNHAIAERAEAIERERALILLQARTSLPTDPTATIAWLERYPPDAPHQDEVLAMIDEAEGRGVARHVWHGASPAADVGFAGDHALVSAHRDGELAREDLETGARQSLVNVHAPLSFVRALGDAIVAIDQRGTLHRWNGALVPAQTIDTPTRITGLFRAGGDAVKVTFVDRPATIVGAARPDLGAFVVVDDENDASAVFTVSESGELAIIEPARRVLWKFMPDTWVRSSRAATAYLAAEPLPDGSSTLWIGRATGEAPIEIARVPPCASGDDRLQSADVADDGRLAVLQKCGVVHAYDVAAHRELAIANPDRIGVFEVSRDSRWLALGRTTGIELVDLATGGSRMLLTGGATARAEISADDGWLFTSGPEQGIRAWRLDAAPAAIGRLALTSSPTALLVPPTGDELAIRRHLACSIWSTREHRLIASTTVPAASARDLDDEPSLWAWDGSTDGRTCLFAGTSNGAVVATIGGPGATVVDEHGVEACVLAGDGRIATCRLGGGFVATFDAATGQRASTPRAAGEVRGLVRYRDRAVVLVARDHRCLLETSTGEAVATLPGSDDCRTARSSNAQHPGAETGVVIDRAGAAVVWTETGTLAVPAETGLVEVSAGGLVAVARDRELEIWDVHTHARAASPTAHVREIQAIAWSPAGVLASADDERIQLWDPAAKRARVIYAPRTTALAWSRDGRSLFTTDGVVVQQWPIDTSLGASVEAVRARLRTVTSARIAGGRPETPTAR